jgi:hypothetical protein
MDNTEGVSRDKVEAVWCHLREALTQGLGTLLHPKGEEIEWVKMLTVAHGKIIDELIKHCRQSMDTEEVMMAYGMPQMFDKQIAGLLLKYCDEIASDFSQGKIKLIEQVPEEWSGPKRLTEEEILITTLGEVRHLAELLQERTKLHGAFQAAVEGKRFEEAHHLIVAIALSQETATDPRGDLELVNLRAILATSEGNVRDFLDILKSTQHTLNLEALRKLIPGLIGNAYIEGIRIASIGRQPSPKEMEEIQEIFWNAVVKHLSKYLLTNPSGSEEEFKKAVVKGCESGQFRLTFYPLPATVEIQWRLGQDR